MRGWLNLSLGLILLLGGTIAVQAMNLQSISDDQVRDLRHRFEKAHSLSPEDLNNEKSWDCHLYGMRSRMQAKEKQKFYKFSASAQQKKVNNNGLQVIRQYAQLDQGLVGNAGPLRDTIRKDDKGRLIAELSIPKKSSETANDLPSLTSNDRVVLVYTVCAENSEGNL